MINLIGIAGSIGAGKDTCAAAIQMLTEIDMRPTAFSGSEPLPIEAYEGVTFALAKSKYQEYKFENRKFAAKLKQVCSLLSGIPIEKFEDQEFKSSQMGGQWRRYGLSDRDERIKWFLNADEAREFETTQDTGHPYLGIGYEQFTVRRFMQLVGTEAIRELIHPNTWVNALFADYRPVSDIKRKSMGNVIDYGDCPFPCWLITDTRFPNEAQAIKDRGGIVIRIDSEKADANRSNHISEHALDNWNFDYRLSNDSTLLDFILLIKNLLANLKIIGDVGKSKS